MTKRKARDLSGVERYREGADSTRYVLRTSPKGDPEAVLTARHNEALRNYRVWDVRFDARADYSNQDHFPLIDAILGVTSDACSRGDAQVVDVRPLLATNPEDRRRNREVAKKVFEELEEYNNGRCVETASSGECKVFRIPTRFPQCSAYGFERPSAEYKARKRRKAKRPGEQTRMFDDETLAPRKPRKTAEELVRIAEEKEARDAAVRKAHDRRSKRCKLLEKERGIRILECSDGEMFKAVNANGEQIGRLDLDEVSPDVYRVSWSGTDESVRGQKVGLALYEAAAEEACKRGWTITSDAVRSRYSENFWAKQERKGRATCVTNDYAPDEGDIRNHVMFYYINDAQEQYIRDNDLEPQAADAYFQENPKKRETALRNYAVAYDADPEDMGEYEEEVAEWEYITENGLEPEAYEAFYQRSPLEEGRAITHYVDEYRDYIDLSDIEPSYVEESGIYYGDPWRITINRYLDSIEKAKSEGDDEKAERLEDELDSLDEKLPLPDEGTWDCHHYELDSSVCSKDEIDLGRLPRTQRERSDFAAKFGKRCFLKTRTSTGGKRYSYQVCDRRGQISCMSARRAYRQARQRGDQGVARKALNTAKKAGCDWTRKGSKKKSKSRRKR